MTDRAVGCAAAAWVLVKILILQEVSRSNVHLILACKEKMSLAAGVVYCNWTDVYTFRVAVGE